MSQQPTLIATTRARTTFLLITAAALALSACTGPAGAEPSASPAPAASAPASQIPDPTSAYRPASEDGPAENVPVPEMPSEASLKSQQGLEAFIPYWFSVFSYAYETGDVSLMASKTTDECRLCQEMVNAIEAGHAGERWIVGGQLQVTDIEDRFVETGDGTYAPIIFVSQAPLTFYESDAAIGEADGIPEPMLWVATVKFSDGQWEMADLQRPEGATG
ncbi:MAG: DUF6318 family protein [Actinomycetota bacterium]